jgi:multiple sugar transport system permease protein
MPKRAYWLALPALVLMASFVFLPLLSVVRYATWQWSGLSEPVRVGFANFRKLTADQELWRSLRITAVYAAILIPSFLYLSQTIALAIENTRFERFVKALLFLPGLMTIAGSVVIWFLLYNPNYGFVVELTRLLFSYLPCHWGTLALPCEGLFLPWDSKPWAALIYVVLFTLWQYVGYGVLVLSAALKAVPFAVKEAAIVDGATAAQIQRLIVLPLLRPSLLFLTVIASVAAIQSYTAVFLLTRGGPFGSTRVIGYYLYETAFERLRLGYGAAMTLVILMITLVLVGFQALFLKGLRV